MAGFSTHVPVTVPSGILLQAEDDGNRFSRLGTCRNISPTALQGVTAKTVVRGSFGASAQAAVCQLLEVKISHWAEAGLGTGLPQLVLLGKPQLLE